MKILLPILLIFPLIAEASCMDDADDAYLSAVNQGDYSKAMYNIANELKLSADARSHFRINSGFSSNNGDHNGLADPDTEELQLGPELFIAGKETACQGMTHEFMHFRQFRNDRKILHAFFTTRPVPEDGWGGCQHSTLGPKDPVEAENDAYHCLEANNFTSHAAAKEIEAILAQLPYATGGILKNADLEYLIENISLWSNSEVMMTNHENESYYLSAIKNEDIHKFCNGVREARKMRTDLTVASNAWQYFCRSGH